MSSLDLATAAASVALAFSALSVDARAAEAPALPLPKSIVIDRSIPAAQSEAMTLAAQSEAMTLAARRYYAFWNTGDVANANASLAPGFIDRSLPPGRPQGPEGPVFASKNFRAVVPDLHADVEEMMLVGDRVIGRLRFTGHFTGSFGSGASARQGDGRAIDFIATDIYRIANGRIAENWHLEDNLSFLQQIGVVAK